VTWLRVAAAFAALLAALPAAAQGDGGYKPHIGQAGKDVIWVPTPDAVVERMLRMAQVTSADTVVDLGAGDGKIAIAAAKNFGARALGIEYNPEMARHAQRNVERAGVAARARIVQGDIFATDFSQASVVTLYLLPALNLRLRPTLLAMRPGTRVVSHSFSMDDWEPDELSIEDGRRIYFWLVPARVAGGWTLQLPGGERVELSLEQRYQKIEGSVELGSVLVGLRDARLSGEQIAFAYVDNQGLRRDFSGRVSGTRMEGGLRADGGAEGRWTASKK
jgi:SAM-dependent methyltransferase